MTDIGYDWYMKNFVKNLSPLIKQNLIKKVQDKDDIIKGNLETSNWDWNDWKFYIHCNMIEWFNPRSNTVRRNPIQIIQINTILNKVI